VASTAKRCSEQTEAAGEGGDHHAVDNSPDVLVTQGAVDGGQLLEVVARALLLDQLHHVLVHAAVVGVGIGVPQGELNGLGVVGIHELNNLRVQVVNLNQTILNAVI